MIGSLFVTSLPYFVLLLALCQVLCGKVYATNKSPPVAAATQGKKNNIELFKTGLITVEFNSTGETAEKKSCNVNDYYSPVVVSAGDVIVALTGVNRTSDNSNDNNNKNVTIVTKYIKIEKKNGTDWGANVVLNGEATAWKSQFAVQHKLENIAEGTSVVKGMLAAANDKKIYLLLVNCSNKNNGDSNNDAKCDVNITVGTVTSETGGKKITWDDGKLEKKNNIEESVTKVKEENQKVFPSGETAIITADNKVVFVGLIANEKKKNAFVVIYSEGDEGKTEFKVSKVESADGCIPAFFSWEKNKIIMIPTHCTEENKKNNPKVKESSDMGSKWSESTGPLARLLGFLQDKNDFTATTINDRNILLFTQQKQKDGEPKVNGKDKYDVHVWFTDGKRVHSVGRIVTDDNITSASLLHTNGELFALHQNWDDKGQKNITLTRMDNQLKNITTVITAWKNADNVAENMCKNIFITSAASSFTEGLVGFLSDNGESNKSWADEYYYVNATVTRGDKVDDGGFTFKEKGAGAKWPVGKPKEDQPYNFTDPGFTLLANVTIDGGAGSGKDNSVMGVVYEESSNARKTVGLLCTQGDEWKLTGNDVQLRKIVTNEKQCRRENAYFVAIVLNNGKLFVYIDGEVLGETGNEISIEHSANITHFYFGADDQKENNGESHVTVRNVLLYNRPFTTEEVGKLKIPQKTKPTEQTNDNFTDTKGDNKKDTHGGNKGTKGGDEESPSQSSRTGKAEEESTSQPESSTVRGGYVGSFVCFVMLVHALCFL